MLFSYNYRTKKMRYPDERINALPKN